MAIWKKKPAQLAAIAALAIGIALAGSFAWSSFNQSRINVFREVMVPDVNLHDDFEGGPNKDIYVENSGTAPIYLRVRLTEFLQTAGRGSLVEGHVRDDDKAYLWAPHNGMNSEGADAIESCVLKDPNTVSADWNGANFHDYYTWLMGGQNEANPTAQIYYKPATAEQKSVYDVDGKTLLQEPQVVSDPLTGTSEAGDASVDYAALVTAKIAELKADVANEGKSDAEIEALALEALGLQKTQTASVMTMAAWIAGDGENRPPFALGNFWVIDPADGWCYWANALPGGSATGLLLDRVNRTDKPFDSDAEYAINAWLQAVTGDDLGKFATAEAGGITAEGQKLLELATGRYVLAADGAAYRKNDDGTYLKYKDADGAELIGQTAFVALGAAAGNEVNTAEENRLYLGRRVIFDPMPEWEESGCANWEALATQTAPWYELRKSDVTDGATEGLTQIYAFTGSKVFDGRIYLTLTAVEADGNGGFPATGRALTVTSVTDATGAYADPGHGPFAPVWAGPDGKLGTGDDTRADPVAAIGGRSFTHLGNGVYVEAASEAEARTRAAEPAVTYFFAGRVVTTATLANAPGNTVEAKVDSVFPLQLAEGDKFNITGGTTANKATAPVTAYEKSETGAYTLSALYTGVDGNYYIYLGTDKLGYIGPGADGFLADAGGASDLRTWNETGLIGDENDEFVYPGDFTEPFLKNLTYGELDRYDTFTADGRTWSVQFIDESGNRLIVAADWVLPEPVAFSPSEDSTNIYFSSANLLKAPLKEFYDKEMPELKPYVRNANLNVENLTSAFSEGRDEADGRSTCGATAAGDSDAPLFVLSQSEVRYSGALTFTSVTGDAGWWTRSPAGETAVYCDDNKKCMVSADITSTKRYIRPAAWVRFSDYTQKLRTGEKSFLPKSFKGEPPERNHTGFIDAFQADGYTWVVLEKDSNGNLLIMTQEQVPGMGYRAVEDGDPLPYAQTLWPGKAKEVFQTLTTLKPYARGVSIPEEPVYAPHGLQWKDVSDSVGISTCTNSSEDATVFVLSVGEYRKYVVDKYVQTNPHVFMGLYLKAPGRRVMGLRSIEEHYGLGVAGWDGELAALGGLSSTYAPRIAMWVNFGDLSQ